MNQKLPQLKAREVLKRLKRAGFKVKRITDSHYILRHNDGRYAVVPFHQGKTIKRGTLHGILEGIKLTIEQFNQLK